MTQTTEPAWTIKRLLDWTDEYFSKSGAESARLDAEVLLAEAIGCTRIELYTQFDQPVAAEPLARFRDWVKRRAAGEPVAYLVGYREFYSLRFSVNADVLIPRPETEHVIVAALEVAADVTERPLRVIDIGTGSGCIALTLAKQLEDSKIAAVDLSPAALDVARENAQALEVSDKVFFYQGDLFAALPSGSAPVHLIVSNPPYIGTDEIGTVDPQVKMYEPEMALFSGASGTDVIARLIAESPSRLLSGGHLIFETSPIIMNACRQLVEDSAEFESPQTIKDFAGLERVLICKKK